MSGRLTKALGIPGWMTSAELEWLEKQATGKSLVIEFGSWHGRSSVVLAAAERLVCVDSWESADEERGKFDQHMAQDMADLRVTVCGGDLQDDTFRGYLIDRFGGMAEMVFVDAAHDEESVARDIETAQALLADDGLLCGHDYSPAWPGVAAAVGRFYSQDRIGRAADSIWYVK